MNRVVLTSLLLIGALAANPLPLTETLLPMAPVVGSNFTALVTVKVALPVVLPSLAAIS